MKWVIQNNIYNEDGYEKLVSALNRLGIPYSVHKVVPFIGELQPDAVPGDRTIVMGSYSMANTAVNNGWYPGAFLDNLNFKTQREHWGAHMLNNDAEIHRFGDVPVQYSPFFLRPVDDGKAFSGTVMDWPEFHAWKIKVMHVAPETLTLDTEVMLCRIKKIYTETRTWIVSGKVVTSSEYKRGTIVRGNSNVDNDILEFAQVRADDWSPNEAYCMDIARTDEGLKIVEVNNLNSSGFYEADMMKLVMALEEAFNE